MRKSLNFHSSVRYVKYIVLVLLFYPLTVLGAQGHISIEMQSITIQEAITVENSINMPTWFPKFVDGATWMEMYNEAQTTRNPGITPRYTQTQIDGTRNKLNPYV